MAEPGDYDRRDDELRRDEPVETPVESAHRRGLITGLVVGVIGGVIVGGIIVGMVDTRPAPTAQPGPVATPEAERQDRILGVPEERDGIEGPPLDRYDHWPEPERQQQPGQTPR